MNKISKKFEENMHFKKFSNKPKTELKNKIYNNKNNKYNINNLDNIYAFNNNKIKTKKVHPYHIITIIIFQKIKIFLYQKIKKI